MSISAAQLLAQVASAGAGGLSDDARETAVFELEGMAKYKAAAQNFSNKEGAAPPVAEEPKWGAVLARATELLGPSRDLRVAAILALAALKTDGLPGLCQGLELLAGLLQKHWDSLYPALDVEDGDDPTMRINAIESIAAPLGNVEDPWRFVLAVHQTALLRSRQLGNIPVGTLLAAKGLALPWPGFPVLEVAAAEGVLRELPALEREKLAQFVEGARGRLTEIVGCFKEKTKGGQSPDMTPLRKELEALASILAPAGEAAASAQAGQPGPASAAAAPKGLASAESASISGEIRTREQVARTLDLICAYYQRYEPSSPLPFLLRRARRLVDSNFLEVMADLAPDALSQIRLATGAEETEKN